MLTSVKYLSIMLVCVFSAAGICLLKLSLRQAEAMQASQLITTLFSQIIWGHRFWLSIFCYGMAFILCMLLLQKNSVGTLITTLVALNLVITNVASMFFLGEQLDVKQVSGILLIIIGVWIING